MGRVKAQYNSVTGKASYTVATGKQQVSVNSFGSAPCAQCATDQPLFIDVSFNDIVDCTGCCTVGVGSIPMDLVLADKLNGNTFRLTKHPTTDCLYFAVTNFTPQVRNRYTMSTNCTGSFSTHSIDDLQIQLFYDTATTFILQAAGNFASPILGVIVFKRTGISRTSGDCFDIEGLVTNTTSCCTVGVSVDVCSGGTATITL